MNALYAGMGCEVLPITTEIAVRSVQFPDSYPKDPQDGFIGATAIVEGLRLLTNDARIAGSGLVAMAGKGRDGGLEAADRFVKSLQGSGLPVTRPEPAISFSSLFENVQ